MYQAVNTTFGVITQWVNIGVAFPVIKSIRGRVVLDDEIIPIQYPECTVRPYLRVYRAKPVVGAGYHIPTIALFFKPSTHLLQDMPVDQPSRGLGDECHPIPIFLW